MFSRLPHPQHGPVKSPERRRLYVKTVDLSLDKSRQRRLGGVPPELSEFLFQMLLGLRRDIPPSLLLLEGGHEPTGNGHRSIIGQSVGGASRPQ
jgi:hypothetical protein